MEDGIILALFQGNRGDRPDIDFILKFLEPEVKKKLRTPDHIHWIVDLLLKMESYKSDVCEILHFYYNFYYEAKPFQTVDERNNYVPKTPSLIKQKYQNLKHKGTYSIEYVCYLIEFFTLCEKVSPRENKMFEQLLICLVNYCEGKSDFYQVLNKAKPGFRRS